MSVEGCYTDFHIDFGGTSVWYHILRGSKVGLQMDLELNTCTLLHVSHPDMWSREESVCFRFAGVFPGVLADPSHPAEPGAV